MTRTWVVASALCSAPAEVQDNLLGVEGYTATSLVLNGKLGLVRHVRALLADLKPPPYLFYSYLVRSRCVGASLRCMFRPSSRSCKLRLTCFFLTMCETGAAGPDRESSGGQPEFKCSRVSKMFERARATNNNRTRIIDNDKKTQL